METTVNDGYIMLLDAIYFGGKKIGNISQDGIDWGGDNAEYIKVYAAQVRTGPVKKMRKKGASNVLKCNLIELLPENCADVMGGTIIDDGWEAPADNIALEAPVKILSGTGQTIEVSRASLEAVVRGKIGGDDPLHIELELEVLQPTNGGAPFRIVKTKPFIEAEPTTLEFKKGGESKRVNLSASGVFSMGKVPEGFEVDTTGGKVVVTATPNSTSSKRTGSLVFTLKDNPEKTVTVTLSQAG